MPEHFHFRLLAAAVRDFISVKKKSVTQSPVSAVTGKLPEAQNTSVSALLQFFFVLYKTGSLYGVKITDRHF